MDLSELPMLSELKIFLSGQKPQIHILLCPPSLPPPGSQWHCCLPQAGARNYHAFTAVQSAVSLGGIAPPQPKRGRRRQRSISACKGAAGAAQSGRAGRGARRPIGGRPMARWRVLRCRWRGGRAALAGPLPRRLGG